MPYLKFSFILILLCAACTVYSQDCIIGTPCNDWDSSTHNDQLNVNCQCVGTPINECQLLEEEGWFDGFESGITGWRQRTNDDLNWSVRSGSTPTIGTGPSSANEGSQYIYVEATGATQQRAVIQSPCISLSEGEELKLSFAYHLNGSSANQLRVGIIRMILNQAVVVYTAIGDKGDQWIEHTLDLTHFAGEDIIITFEGRTGSTDRSDVAIDRISLNQCPDELIVSDPIPPMRGTYQANISVVSNEILESGSDVTFRAGRCILLLPDFSVDQNATFIAEIGSCK